MHQCMYNMSTFFRHKRVQELNPHQNVQSSSFLTVQMIEVLIICILTWRKRSKLLLLDVAISLHRHFKYT